MTRETSIAIYHDLEASGALSRLRLLVARDIAFNGPVTQAESTMRLAAGRAPRYQYSFAPRFAELERQDVIETIGERVCAVSGQVCLSWDLSGRTPVALTKLETRIEQERQACLEIARAVQGEAQTDHGRRAAQEIANRIAARATS